MVLISVVEMVCAPTFGRLGGDFDGLRLWLSGSAQFVGCGEDAFFHVTKIPYFGLGGLLDGIVGVAAGFANLVALKFDLIKGPLG